MAFAYYYFTTAETLGDVLDATDLAMETVDLTIREKLREIAALILQEAKSNLSSYADRIGAELASSLRILDEGGFSIEIGSTLPYAVYVEFGHGPAPAKEIQSLHWVDNDDDDADGKDTSVRYRGPAEARPFMEPAIFKYIPQLGSLLKQINPQD